VQDIQDYASAASLIYLGLIVHLLIMQ